MGRQSLTSALVCQSSFWCLFKPVSAYCNSSLSDLESQAETHQELVEKIPRSIYVDDVVSETPSEKEAYNVY